jgi:hypothetical protein
MHKLTQGFFAATRSKIWKVLQQTKIKMVCLDTKKDSFS